MPCLSVLTILCVRVYSRAGPHAQEYPDGALLSHYSSERGSGTIQHRFPCIYISIVGYGIQAGKQNGHPSTTRQYVVWCLEVPSVGRRHRRDSRRTMGRVQHGRRMGSKLADAADEGDAGASSSRREEAVFRIEVQAPDDPESFKLSTQMVSSEYATRYLERLGIKPSKATLELVHKSVPLSDSCMKTTLRVRSLQPRLSVPLMHYSLTGTGA